MWIKCQNEQTFFNTEHMHLASIAKQGPAEPKAPVEGEEVVDVTPEKFYILFRNSTLNAIYSTHDTFEEAQKEFAKIMKKIS